MTEDNSSKPYTEIEKLSVLIAGLLGKQGI